MTIIMTSADDEDDDDEAATDADLLAAVLCGDRGGDGGSIRKSLP
jgi:hypothetical protein